MDAWHHGGVRRALLIALLTAPGPAAAAVPVRLAPALALVARTPLTVGGAHFAPGSAVRITVESVSLETRANGAGRFRVLLRGVRLGSCGSARVRAVGARGQRASLEIPPAACMARRE